MDWRVQPLDALDRLTNWCRDDALPFWAQNGMDPSGGCYETLDLDGNPNRGDLRRVRVQARMAYTYAHAAYLGWYNDAKTTSDHCWNYLINKGFTGGEHGCAHLLNPDGTLHDGLRDTYAQSFVILAGAWRYRAFNDEAALDVAKATLAFLERDVSANNGGWHEGLPASLPRRQNPHMHMFEALIVLYDATQDMRYLNRAGDIYLLFKQHFFDEKSGTIIEFFNADWSRASGNGGPVEPGHMMEWVWLLHQFSKRTGEHVLPIMMPLFEAALKIGQNPKTGLLFDTDIAKTSRSWSQTEFLKASLALVEVDYDRAWAFISSSANDLWSYFIAPAIKGGWVDQVGASGQRLSSAMPASTFYHYMCACAEAAAFADRLR